MELSPAMQTFLNVMKNQRCERISNGRYCALRVYTGEHAHWARKALEMGLTCAEIDAIWRAFDGRVLSSDYNSGYERELSLYLESLFTEWYGPLPVKC